MKKGRRIGFGAGIAGLFLAAAVLLCGCGKESRKPRAVAKMHLEITSEPSGAQIAVNGTELGKTPKKFSVKPGNYLLRFSREGYESKFVPLEVTGSGEKTLSVPLKKAFCAALILSTPSQAQVIVGEEVMGETPYVLSPLAAGKHVVRLRKSGFAIRTVEFETKDARPVKIAVDLQSNVGKLVIRSTPSQATVFINGKAVGMTPYSGSWSEGTVDYRIQLGGYGEVTGTKTVVRGKTVTVEQALQLLPASLKVESIPAGATVWIGKNSYGKTPLTIRNLAPDREHTVVLRLPGCGDESRKVSIRPGTTGSITVRLSSDKGGIDLLSGPAGLAVYCDGKKVGILQQSSEGGETAAVLEIRNLMPGKHKISIAHSRGIPARVEKEVVVEKNKIVRVSPGTIWVPNAVIHYHDGQSATGYLHGESKEKGYWFEDARYHDPAGGTIRGYIPYEKVRSIERLPLGE